jgi:hypothetical protein
MWPSAVAEYSGRAEDRVVDSQNRTTSGGAHRGRWADRQSSRWLLVGLLICSTAAAGAIGGQAAASAPRGSGCLQAFSGGDKGLAPVYGRCARCAETLAALPGRCWILLSNCLPARRIARTWVQKQVGTGPNGHGTLQCCKLRACMLFGAPARGRPWRGTPLCASSCKVGVLGCTRGAAAAAWSP